MATTNFYLCSTKSYILSISYGFLLLYHDQVTSFPLCKTSLPSLTCVNKRHNKLFNANVDSDTNSKEQDFYLRFLYPSQSHDTTKRKEDILSREQITLITNLIDERSAARLNEDYELADAIRRDLDNIMGHVLPHEYSISVTDIARKDGGGSTWDIKQNIVPDDDDNDTGCENVLALAHAALGMSTSSSGKNVPLNHDEMNALVQRAKILLLTNGAGPLHGRKAADAAFWFALAGARDQHDEDGNDDESNFSLFTALTYICVEELKRFGSKPTCRAVDIMHIVERIAGAGVRGEAFIALQKVAATCLQEKLKDESKPSLSNDVVESLHNGRFKLHSPKSLQGIWRFSTRQRKQRAFLESASQHWIREEETSGHVENLNSNITFIEVFKKDWGEVFDDPSLPLVIDVGCGMGISLLGLASIEEDYITNLSSGCTIDWKKCNFIGADLSQLAINYAKSIANRWKLDGRLSFQVQSADDIINDITNSYPGEVRLVMIQFPTPFRLSINKQVGEGMTENESKGNSQLPSDHESGFMVTKNLLGKIRDLLKGTTGVLLLQSNCEDVAVYMKNAAVTEVGFHQVNAEVSVDSLPGNDNLPRRTVDWIAMGGERAQGISWSRKSYIPQVGATETEVSCLLSKVPIHRCLLQSL